MKPRFILLLMCPLLFITCKDKPEPPTIFVDQETKDFCAFKAGTYWVYQNTRTNALDTWKVTKLHSKIQLADERRNPENIEHIEVSISTRYNDTFMFVIMGGGTLFSTNKHFGLDQVVYYEGNLQSFPVCDNLNLQLLKKEFDSTVCIYKEFKMEDAPCTNVFPYHTKWDRHKGIREMVYPNQDTLRMVSHHIL